MVLMPLRRWMNHQPYIDRESGCTCEKCCHQCSILFIFRYAFRSLVSAKRKPFFRGQCGQCSYENLAGAQEFRCCKEVANASAKMTFDALMQYIKHERKCFIGISKHREKSWKYDAQRSTFDEIGGVWNADITLVWVFDISSQSKHKLRSKRRSKMVKIYVN